MWRRVEVNASIDQPVEQVFPYLADPRRWHEFAPACVYRRQIGDGPPDIGTQWEATDLIGPFPMRFIDELAELELNRRVVWLSSAPWNARVEYACQPGTRGDTRVRATYEGDISGSLRLLVGWIPSPATHWILAQDFRRLRRVLARQAGSASAVHQASDRSSA
jgi:polyketide cyclase/dehydrase/lipid transport protein